MRLLKRLGVAWRACGRDGCIWAAVLQCSLGSLLHDHQPALELCGFPQRVDVAMRDEVVFLAQLMHLPEPRIESNSRSHTTRPSIETGTKSAA